jgi:rhamnulokinase
MGLWLLQQMQKSFAKKGDDYSYDQMVKLALEDRSDVVLINPDDKLFIFPDDMCEAIREFCKRTDQPVPKTPGHFIRCVTESLALSHKHVIDQLTNVLGREFKCINIVGGGSLNSLLCQLTADFTGLKVYAGPVEATIIGNLLTQAFALGHISSVEQIRQISRDSAPLKRYEPKSVPKLNELYNMYLKLL